MFKDKDEKTQAQEDQFQSAPQVQAEEQASKQSAGHKARGGYKKKELLEKLQRVTADFANYQKRMARDIEQSARWARAEMIKSILPAIDDFEQALEAGKTARDVPSLLKGFELVHQHLLNMLNKQRVQTVATEGEKFDPAIHEAMMQLESAEHQPGTVVAELRKGYIMDGRTLRPARVTVSKGSSDGEESEVKNKESQ